LNFGGNVIGRFAYDAEITDDGVHGSPVLRELLISHPADVFFDCAD